MKSGDTLRRWIICLATIAALCLLTFSEDSSLTVVHAAVRRSEPTTFTSVTRHLPSLSTEASPGSVTEQQVNAAIDRGLQYLHRTAKQAADGTIYWDTTYPEATAASVVLAFEVSGHVPGRSWIVDPYVTTVKGGLNYVFASLRKQAISRQPAGDPDSNGNGYGLYVAVGDTNVVIYTTGIALMAVAASNMPDAVADIGGDGVQGRKYSEIAQDMVDYLAWAQIDPPNSGRGGWRYEPNASEADMSVTQWPVLGMEAAVANMRATVPEWVKTELREGFLTYAQGSDGGFGYTGPDGGNIARTGAGLVGLAFTGVPADDDRVRRAVDFVAANWNSDNLGNFYAMYGLMKGSRLTRPEIKQYGSHDWYAEYAYYLVTRQETDGSWKEAFYSRGNIPLATAWAILILSRTVFTPIRLNLPLWVLLPLLLVPLGGLAFWLRRRASFSAPRRIERPVVTVDRRQEWAEKAQRLKPTGEDNLPGAAPDNAALVALLRAATSLSGYIPTGGSGFARSHVAVRVFATPTDLKPSTGWNLVGMGPTFMWHRLGGEVAVETHRLLEILQEQVVQKGPLVVVWTQEPVDNAALEIRTTSNDPAHEVRVQARSVYSLPQPGQAAPAKAYWLRLDFLNKPGYKVTVLPAMEIERGQR